MMPEDICIETFNRKLGERVKFKGTLAKAEPYRSSWWLVFIAASIVCFAIWGMGL